MSLSPAIDKARRRIQEAAQGHNIKGSIPADRPAAAGPEAYFDSTRRSFWALNARGEWTDISETSLKRRLRLAGYHRKEPEDGTLSPLDKRILDLETQHDVHWAGQLAGFMPGVHLVEGQRILVTRGFVFPGRKDVKFPTLSKFLKELLADQVPYFNGWIKSAVASLLAGPQFTPGQALAIAGGSGCGKSLLQQIITQILGGRVRKPYRYLTGMTSFNQELLEGEHLCIEDEAASTDIRIRREFGANVKNMIVNHVQSYHPKNRPAVSLTPFWRVSVTLNDEAENLMVLPPFDESLRDKFMLFKASPASFPWKEPDKEIQGKFWATLCEEIPGYLHWLHRWRIPEALRDSRYGVVAYSHPDLLDDVDNLSPELRLLSLIDMHKPWGKVREWRGTTEEFERHMRETDQRTGEVARLLSWSQACGQYLARLAKKRPERVEGIRGAKNRKTWIIHEPPPESEGIEVAHGGETSGRIKSG